MALLKKLAGIERLIVAHRAKGRAAAHAEFDKDEGKTIMDDIRVVVARMTEREDQLLAEREKLAKSSYQGATTMTSDSMGPLVDFAMSAGDCCVSMMH